MRPQLTMRRGFSRSGTLRHWLERALALDEEHAYRTVRDTQDAFEALDGG